MRQVAIEKSGVKTGCVPAATQVPVSGFFALMAGLWGSFVTLLAVSPSTLDNAYD